MLYNLYAIMAGMTNEVKADFVQYMPSDAAKYQAFVQDYQDFYNKGPGTTESAGVTWNYVRALRDDFFTEVDAIARGDLSHGAKLRFTHAEAIIPLATAMGLKTVVGALPAGKHTAMTTATGAACTWRRWRPTCSGTCTATPAAMCP